LRHRPVLEATVADLGVHLNYFLPLTEFLVTVTQRVEVRVTERGSFTHDVADVVISPGVIADRDAPARLILDAKCLEKIDVTVTLDDAGVISSVNADASQDVAPVISLVGKAITLLSPLRASLLGVVRVENATPPTTAPPSLEEEWTSGPGRNLESHRAALEARAQDLLGALGSLDIEPAETITVAQALGTVQDQLALIGQIRREWVAAHARTKEVCPLRLLPSELVQVRETHLPVQLDASSAAEATGGRWGDALGVVIAIADQPPPASPRPSLVDQRDRVPLRRSRPVEVGVYEQDDHDGWVLRPETLVRMDVVDSASLIDLLPIDARWFRTRSYKLDYHPDKSLKSFGIQSASSISTVASAVGEVMDAVGDAREKAAKEPSEEQAKLAKAKAQLEMMQVGNDIEVLAATRVRASELAVLEQAAKIRESRA
jgi:hypothetical protein